MKPNDPFFSRQWHFGLLGDIQAVWNEFNGAGVHAGVFDGGIDFTNPDLAARQDATRNVVVNGQTRNGAPNDASTEEQNHGTAVAGLLAGSGNNGLGTTGVAWGASLTSVNIFDSTKPEYVNATDSKAFLSAMHQMVKFEVANHSWGSPVDFSPYSNPTLASSFVSKVTAEYAFASAQGRNGLGTVVVQAAGNEGLDANGAGSHGSRYSVTVAATESDGKVAAYSNYGACILVCAPGGGDARGLVTTDRKGTAGYTATLGDGFDRTGNYSDKFAGTSGAAPIVSGVVSLMLQANPDLGWRDVQTILALSATHTGSAIKMEYQTVQDGESSFWKFNGASNWNGGGLHYSEDYGFGMVDAFNAVRMAEAWKLFPGAPQTSANEKTFDTGTRVFNTALWDNTGGINCVVDIDADISIEHLALTLDITHEYVGDLSVSLTSPDGTSLSAKLLAAAGPTDPGGSRWTFGFDGFRGTLAAGKWLVGVSDDYEGNTGVLNSLRVVGYGAAPVVDDVYHFTDEFAEMCALPSFWNEARNRGFLSDTDGGSDWIDASSVHSPVIADLEPGTFTIDGASLRATNGDDIGVIENVVSGDGADNLRGDADANKLYGMRGNDTLDGGKGADELQGGKGDDTLVVKALEDTGGETYDGGDGNDTLRLLLGGTARFNLADDDIRSVERLLTGDTGQKAVAIIQLLASQVGNGQVSGAATITGLSHAQAEDSLSIAMSGAKALDLSKLNFVNFNGVLDHVTVSGGVEAETITGSVVRDFLDGGGGADTMRGLAGDDTYTVDDAGDVVDEGAAGSSGIDTVRTAVSISLADGAHFRGSIENAILTGSARLNLSGNGLANVLTGNAANNALDGGGGADTLRGLGGNDAYLIDDAGDVVDESAPGSKGTDTVRSSVRSIDLADAARFKGAVENATLLGSASLNGTGNGLANLLTGNAGANRLDGGAGNDTARGLAGNDTYVIDSAGDIVDESAFGSSGADRIVSAKLSVDLNDAVHVLGDIERATLTGSLGLNLSGNGLANLLTGNAGRNLLNGREGKDTLFGGTGDDVFVFDTALGRANVDVIGDFGTATGDNDAIRLAKSIFAALAGNAGATLSGDQFVANATGAAQDGGDRIIYDTQSGALFYDADGSTAAVAKVQFAQLGPTHPALTGADFLLA